MALSDYLEGPEHKVRADVLEAELKVSEERCEKLESALSDLRGRYGHWSGPDFADT